MVDNRINGIFSNANVDTKKGLISVYSNKMYNQKIHLNDKYIYLYI